MQLNAKQKNENSSYPAGLRLAECWPGNCADHHDHPVVDTRYYDELHVRHYADNDRHDSYAGHHAIDHVDYRWLDHEQWNNEQHREHEQRHYGVASLRHNDHDGYV